MRRAALVLTLTLALTLLLGLTDTVNAQQAVDPRVGQLVRTGKLRAGGSCPEVCGESGRVLRSWDREANAFTMHTFLVCRTSRITCGAKRRQVHPVV